MAAYPQVIHQLVELDVNVEKRTVSGKSELQCKASASTTSLGLNAFGLDVKRVLVNGVAAGFQLSPYTWEHLPEALLAVPTSKQAAASATLAEDVTSEYSDFLDRERQPELILQVAGLLRSHSDTRAPGELPPVPQDPRQVQQTEFTVTVFYSVSPGVGFAFYDDCALTCHQLRRSRAWVPCVDQPSSVCRWDIKVQAAARHTVLAPGQLVEQANVGRRMRLWHYSVNLQVPASQVVVVVGSLTPGVDERPVEPLYPAAAEFLSPGDDGGAALGDAAALEGEEVVVTHFARPQRAPLLEGTYKAVRLVQALLEQWLTCRLPFGMYSQVFLPLEMTRGNMICVPGLSVLSEDDMCPPGGIELCRKSRIAQAAALIRQWFGCLLMPATPADDWIIHGLQGYVLGVFVKCAYGASELAYLRLKERDAVRPHLGAAAV